MKYTYPCFFVLLLGLNINAYSLGRIFISPEDRVKLEKLRNAKEEKKEEEFDLVRVEDILQEKTPEEENKITIPISLKGVVERENGKHTAWINESNTNEGDLESEFIQIPEDEIDSAGVTIIMPDNKTRMKLKVGEQFIPETVDESPKE